MERIGIGGGCHWCTEGIFQTLRGVAQVDQGLIRSDPPADRWAEGVIVHFDPAIISLAILIEAHLRTHAASYAADSKYRSAIYVHDEGQRCEAGEAIEALGRRFDAPIDTRILPLRAFKPADERFRNYYATDPGKPFCRRYIDPKLDLIRREFAGIALPATPEPADAAAPLNRK